MNSIHPWQTNWESGWGSGWWLNVIVSKCLPQLRDVTNSLGFIWKSTLIICPWARQKGLLWRAGHRWSSEWNRGRHTSTYMRTPTHMRTKGCRLAHHLGTRHMPQQHTTCSVGPCWENAHKHMLPCTHFLFFSFFYHCSTFPPNRSLSCILMCNCVYVGCGDKNSLSDRNAWWCVVTHNLHHFTAHISRVKYGKHK